jgi:hypothetical protein
MATSIPLSQSCTYWGTAERCRVGGGIRSGGGADRNGPIGDQETFGENIRFDSAQFFNGLPGRRMEGTFTFRMGTEDSAAFGKLPGDRPCKATHRLQETVDISRQRRTAHTEAMNEIHLNTARPLTQVAPVIMDSGMFTLKGGTAINLIASGEK